MMKQPVKAYHATYGWPQPLNLRVFRSSPCAWQAFIKRVKVNVMTEKLMSWEAVI